jgi:hypothetical protein
MSFVMSVCPSVRPRGTIRVPPDGSFRKLIFVDISVEIPTRCSFVIEFIIPKFIEGSTCFERDTAHHQEL